MLCFCEWKPSSSSLPVASGVETWSSWLVGTMVACANAVSTPIPGIKTLRYTVPVTLERFYQGHRFVFVLCLPKYKHFECPLSTYFITLMPP